jgi:hypothetical protein
MFDLLASLFGRTASHKARRVPASRPRLECLEDRTVPTVTFHGGPVLPNVEVQPVFFGGNRNTPAGLADAGYINGFLNSAVKGPFMGMLTSAGYQVGPGKVAAPLFTGPLSVAQGGGTQVNDLQMQGFLAGLISSGKVARPNANTLFVFLVQPGEVDTRGSGSYHDSLRSSFNVPYAVVSHPTDSAPLLPGFTLRDYWTTTISHELAEAVTDPYYAGGNSPNLLPGWNDDNPTAYFSRIYGPTYGARFGNISGEVADLTYPSLVYLNGYAVDRIADQNDQPMTPAGARPQRPVDFVLTGHNLYASVAGGPLTFVASGIQSISDQGIDLVGRAMVSAVTTGGAVWEFHDDRATGGFTTVSRVWNPFPGSSAVRSAAAGQGVTYFSLTNGNLFEYLDGITDLYSITDPYPGFSLPSAYQRYGTYSEQNIPIADFVNKFSAGTDGHGVNMVCFVIGGSAFEKTDDGAIRRMGANVQQVSAGQQGISAWLGLSGQIERFDDRTGVSSLLPGTATSVSAGADQNGNAMIVATYTDGRVLAFDGALYPVTGSATLNTGALAAGLSPTAASKPHAGVIDLVFSDPLFGGFGLRFSPTPTGFDNGSFLGWGASQVG